MTTNNGSKKSMRSNMSGEARKTQLIKATIKCIAKKGLSSTTMVDVTSEAGLSLGIVNLHFQSKEKLLNETLRYVSDEYRIGSNAIFSDDSKTVVEKIIAHVDYDFCKKNISRNKLAVWFAFWGEAKSRPIYQDICAKHDVFLSDNLTQLFFNLKSSGNYQQVKPEIVNLGYTALIDGLWLDLLITPNLLSVETARAVALNYLMVQFPKHFSD
ncbi:MAG: TetR/AcrR family bet gene transcriptional repressor [Enterobacterales bacterium]|jgi:TetR/AcrR family transcriptional repressor of bet genes